VAAQPGERLEALMATALEALPQPVMVYDADRVVYANAASCEMLGARSPGDLIGVRLDQFLAPEFADASNERRQFVVSAGLELSELRVKIRTLDGQTLTMDVDVRPLPFDGVTFAMVSLAR
jgi:PAS domain S-box-containing protein